LQESRTHGHLLIKLMLALLLLLLLQIEVLWWRSAFPSRELSHNAV
jgi:hypothetical protein